MLLFRVSQCLTGQSEHSPKREHNGASTFKMSLTLGNWGNWGGVGQKGMDLLRRGNFSSERWSLASGDDLDPLVSSRIQL